MAGFVLGLELERFAVRLGSQVEAAPLELQMTYSGVKLHRRLATFDTALEFLARLLGLAFLMKCDRLHQARRRLGRLFRLGHFFHAQREIAFRGFVFRFALQHFPVTGGRVLETLPFHLQSAHGGIQLHGGLSVQQAGPDLLNSLVELAFQMQNDGLDHTRREALSWRRPMARGVRRGRRRRTSFRGRRGRRRRRQIDGCWQLRRRVEPVDDRRQFPIAWGEGKAARVVLVGPHPFIVVHHSRASTGSRGLIAFYLNPELTGEVAGCQLGIRFQRLAPAGAGLLILAQRLQRVS